MDREERRARTQKAVERQMRVHRRFVCYPRTYTWRSRWEWVCDICNGREGVFRKRRALSCACSKKTHGRPKVSGGMCFGSGPTPAAKARTSFRVSKAKDDFEDRQPPQRARGWKSLGWVAE